MFDEVLYAEPPYTFYRRTEKFKGQKGVRIGTILPLAEMSIITEGDVGWSREHLDFSNFKYIEPEADIEIDGIPAKDISLSYIWKMNIHGTSGIASRTFLKKIWVVGSKDVNIEINGEVIRLKGFKIKRKIINQGQVYVSESEATWVPYISQPVEWKAKERWQGGSRSVGPVKYYDLETTPEVMTYLRCIQNHLDEGLITEEWQDDI